MRSAPINEQFDTRDKLELSDAKYSAALATSPGSPMRPIGTVDTIRAITSADCRLVSGVRSDVGDGRNRWPAVHVLDAVRLYRLALEKLETGARYHAVAEEGVPMRDIAEVIGRGVEAPVISVSPEEAPAHFGWLAAFAGRDVPASSALTQERLAWRPTGPGLIADLEQMRYRETETDVASAAPARAAR